ncbi:hypothetical protein QFC19_008465 [Naganishia cerealis]|uniref:Uncharacterized protein n=1 Tax=Naganishia cerealis TaxID=610337 RepID=A0ACC2V3C4_9TREE|nr:hypothetical protein QFC19_008465 [Naganishia cerealis]
MSVAIVRSPLADIPLPPLQSFFNYYLPSKPRYPDYTAFIDGVTGRNITVAQLRRDSLRLGLGIQDLLKLSLSPQTVAVIYSPNSIDFVQIFYGCQSTKVITSLANASYTATELAHQLRDGEPSIAFVHPSIYDAYLGAIKLLETEGRSAPKLFWAVPENEVPRELMRNTPDAKSYQALLMDEATVQNFQGTPAKGEEAHETALLCYSSGTTGLAKGVMSTHHNLNVNGEISAKSCYPENLAYGKGSMILNACPMYHLYGLMEAVIIPLLTGVPVVNLPKFTPEGFFRAIQNYKANAAFVVPPMVLHLANNPLAANYDLSSLKWMRSAAAPLGQGLIRKVKSKLGDDVHITQGYGLTEVTCLCTAQTVADALSNPGSVGRLYPCLQAKIVDEHLMPAKVGEPGELCIKGPTVMNIVDRLKELIKYKGFQVPPADLEKLLLTNPKVGDVAVIGVHSREFATELPRAYVVPAGGLDKLSAKEREELALELVSWVEKNVCLPQAPPEDVPEVAKSLG